MSSLQLWNIFKQTGKVEDYLKYCAQKKTEKRKNIK